MNGAEYLCKILKNKGVVNIFGLFGDIQTNFAHAVMKSNIRWIGVHNEKSGGFMADIYARVSGKPGVFFSTLGPGGTNLTSALANATQDRSPLIAISDQVPVKEFNTETHQYIDFEKAFHKDTGITKLALVVRSVDELPTAFDRAFKIAVSEPKGAVHISVPADILGHNVSHPRGILLERKTRFFTYPRSSLSYRELCRKLTSAKRHGVIIAGGSIERAMARKEFQMFVEKFDLPVLTTFRGKNAISSNHPQYLGTISRHLVEVIDKVMGQAEFIVTIGYDYNEGIKPELWKGREGSVININSYDNRIKGVFEPISLFGDLRDIFKRLSSLSPKSYGDSFDYRYLKRKIHTTISRELDVHNAKLHPARIIDAINKSYSKNGIIVCDVGLNKYYSGLLLASTNSNQIIFSNGQSAMAFSSGAVGAKIANPKKDVIVLAGDGGFLMDPQEVLTSTECNMPVIWVVFNNGGFGLVEQAQQKNGSYVHGVHFNKVFFTKLAQAFGIAGIRLRTGEDLLPILKRIKKSKRSAIIDVPVEYTPRRKTY